MQLSERTASEGGLKPLEQHTTIILMDLKGALNQAPIIPRDASLPDSQCKSFQNDAQLWALGRIFFNLCNLFLVQAAETCRNIWEMRPFMLIAITSLNESFGTPLFFNAVDFRVRRKYIQYIYICMVLFLLFSEVGCATQMLKQASYVRCCCYLQTRLCCFIYFRSYIYAMLGCCFYFCYF